MTGIRIQMRRGTAAQWASVNPVLAAGEWGLDTTNKLVKIGDGTSTWSQLTVADPKAHAASHASAGGDPVTLAQSQITNLTTDLAGKAASVHSHAQSDVTGLVSDLAGKAASVHSHVQSDVTGLDTALSGKASTTHASTHAPAGSDPLTVAQSQVTGLPADLAARVTGPASSTDNTLPRFDLATGKVLQGSGVTVDDSNNISGLGTVAGTGLAGSLLSSTSPVMDGVAAAGTGVVPSRQDHVHPTDTSRAPTASPTFTGRVTVASGAANGISQSGTLDLVGTGSPEGVVTAPVGSTWRDTNATTGAIKWIKTSGTGNTGWVVEFGDTGWRNLAAEALSNGWSVGVRLQLRRSGATVRINGEVSAAAATAQTLYTLPSGFRAATWEYLPVLSDTSGTTKACELGAGGSIRIYSYATGAHYLSFSWLTTNPWPSSLPGTAA